jgi:hypothetical protein
MHGAIGTMTHGARRAQLQIAALFASTLFAGAFLLFWIQPLFGKMALPLLGGAPNVWVTAMLFFQAVLLLGYGYAHLTAQLSSVRTQAMVHLAVLAVGFISLPIAIAQVEPPKDWPVLWLISLAAVSIGWPFFALSATAPLMQRWFAFTRHADASDPYFLYAASNLGSIMALLAYPLLLEPFLRLGEQSWGWTAGYALLVAMTMACGLRVVRTAPIRDAASAPAGGRVFAPITWRQRGLWIALAFAPSSLLLGVTTHITTDVASAPLLWVIPLILYLLTFVIAFSRRPILRHHWMVRLQPFVLLPALFLMMKQGQLVTFVSDIVVFFVMAIVCHGELVRRRPDAAHLTEFYFLMSVGGVLGGVFNAVIAPVAFDGVYEFAIALAVACLLRPGAHGGTLRERTLDIALPAVLLGLMLVLWLALVNDLLPIVPKRLLASLMLVVPAVAIFGFSGRPIRFGLGVGAVLILTTLIPGIHVLDRQRSFFGVYSIVGPEDGSTHVLRHGTTIHGAQITDSARWREPLTYYTRQGPVGQVFSALNAADRLKRVGVVGLGVGSVVCYRLPGQRWTIYEIDPVIERIARDTRYFRYMSECFDAATMEVRLGDARLTLANQPTERFDLLVLDAFSSDSVPIHLLTREALALYRGKLNERGVILLNISNRYLDLTAVLGRLIDDAGMHGLVQTHSFKHRDINGLSSAWVVLARDAADLQPFAADARWKPLTAPPYLPVWTDDFSNILGVLKRVRKLPSLSELWRD